MESTIVPQLDENGIPFQFTSVRTDITAAKDSEQEMVRLYLEAVEAREVMEEQAQSLVAMSEAQAEDKKLLTVAAAKSDKLAAEEQVVTNLLKVAINTDTGSDDDMPRFLDKSLDVLISETPWLHLTSTGCIFLQEIVDNETVLVLNASVNLTPEREEKYSRVKFGQILFGGAAVTQDAEFSNADDHCHDSCLLGT